MLMLNIPLNCAFCGLFVCVERFEEFINFFFLSLLLRKIIFSLSVIEMFLDPYMNAMLQFTFFCIIIFFAQFLLFTCC